jgi:hypothetical protein
MPAQCQAQSRSQSPSSQVVRCTLTGADAYDIACGDAQVHLAWRDGAWWVQTGGYMRRLRSEHGRPFNGFYDPGDGLPPHGGAFEVPDAPRRPQLIAERRYRSASRPAALKAAERLARGIAADPRTLTRELAMHPGWLPVHH